MKRTPPVFHEEEATLGQPHPAEKRPEPWPMPTRAMPCSEHSEEYFLPREPEIHPTRDSNPGRGGATRRPRLTELATLGK